MNAPAQFYTLLGYSCLALATGMSTWFFFTGLASWNKAFTSGRAPNQRQLKQVTAPAPKIEKVEPPLSPLHAPVPAPVPTPVIEPEPTPVVDEKSEKKKIKELLKEQKKEFKEAKKALKKKKRKSKKQQPVSSVAQPDPLAGMSYEVSVEREVDK